MINRKIQVLIADDSIVYRSQIKAAIESIAEAEVISVASNGKIATEKMQQMKVDLLILDLEMPVMDGIETLKEIKRKNIKCKTMVFSSVSKRGAEITLEALNLGASDFITKPDSSESSVGAPSEKIKNLILPKIQALFPDNFNPDRAANTEFTNNTNSKVIWDLFNPKVLVIGSSTGGPTVLEKIFSNIQGPIKCPILIAQHMPPLFTATLAERISKLSGIPAREAIDGEKLENGVIYMAPGDYHLTVRGEINNCTLHLDQTQKINSVRPAVDPLFESVAKIFNRSCLGLVLTGMGADGKDGAKIIKAHMGAVVIQEKSSCVVFGMPGAVFECGAYDVIATPDEIIQIIKTKICSNYNFSQNYNQKRTS